MTFEEKMKAIKEFFDSYTPDEFCDMLERDFGIKREKDYSWLLRADPSTVRKVSSALGEISDCPYDSEVSPGNETICEAA